jgi:hypothetical protein
MTELHPDVGRQIERLILDQRRPVIVTDADEVLFAFMADFETWLGTKGYRFAWGSFSLSGNIREATTDRALDQSEMPALLGGYFADRTEFVPAVEGAATALARLSARAQVVVLSNLPLENREARARALARAGMHYPLVANIGAKGAAVAAIAARSGRPVVFLDDGPNHIVSVGKAVPDSLRLHFVADPRLAKLIGPAKDSHRRVDRWDEATRIIEAALEAGAPTP